MSSTNSCNTHSTGALAVSAQCLSPRHSSAPTSPRTSPQSGGPLVPGALSAGGAAVTAAVATGAAGIAAAAAGSAVTSMAAPHPGGGFTSARSSSSGGGGPSPHPQPGPSPLGTQPSSHGSYSALAAAAPAAAAGSMLTAPKPSHTSPQKDRLWHSTAARNLSPLLHTHPPTASSLSDALSQHLPHSSLVMTSKKPPHTQPETRPAMGLKLWHYRQRPLTHPGPSGVAPPGALQEPHTAPSATTPDNHMHNSAAGALTTSSSARLLSNVEAVAASSRSPVRFQNILEGSTESRTSSESFVTRSDTSSGSSAHHALFSPNAQGDQSELTFAEDLTHSSRSVSLGGGRSSSSPQSPPPAKFGASANLLPIANFAVSGPASRSAPWAMMDDLKTSKERATLVLVPEDQVSSAAVSETNANTSTIPGGSNSGTSQSQSTSLQVLVETAETLPESPHDVHASAHGAAPESSFAEASKAFPVHELKAQRTELEAISLCLPPEPPAATVATGVDWKHAGAQDNGNMREAHAPAPPQPTPQQPSLETRFMHVRAHESHPHDASAEDPQEGGMRGGARRGGRMGVTNKGGSPTTTSAASPEQKMLFPAQREVLLQRKKWNSLPTGEEPNFQAVSLIDAPLADESLRFPAAMMPTSASSGVCLSFLFCTAQVGNGTDFSGHCSEKWTETF